jgi:lipopolysaccharide transport system ATP-binding protein
MIGVGRVDGTAVYAVATDMDGVLPHRVSENRFAFELTLPRVALLPGKYLLRAHALDPEGVRLFDTVERPLQVTGETRELGFVRLEHRWEMHTSRIRAEMPVE